MATDEGAKTPGSPGATLADDARLEDARPRLSDDSQQPTTVHPGVTSSPWDDKTTIGRDVPPPPRLRTAAEVSRDGQQRPWDESDDEPSGLPPRAEEAQAPVSDARRSRTGELPGALITAEVKAPRRTRTGEQITAEVKAPQLPPVVAPRDADSRARETLAGEPDDWSSPIVRPTEPAMEGDWREPTRIRRTDPAQQTEDPEDWREPTLIRPSAQFEPQEPTRVEPAPRGRTSEQVPQVGGRKPTSPLVRAAVQPPVPDEPETEELDQEAREVRLLGSMLGEYRVLEKLGSGGGGVVYRGEQPLIGRAVAIKVLHRELHVQDAAHARRFLEEARAVNAARHPNIIDVFSFGQTPAGEPYLVMELLEGEPLDKLLRRRGGLPVKEAIGLALPVLGALSAAHAAGIVHRDLKPANIFIVTLRDGTTFPKLLDFGLARRGAAGAMLRQTSVGGTPLYIAPEQANGDEVGPQTDLYSFGCVMYALLTGRPPFTAVNLGELIDSHRKLAPPPLRERAPNVPAALEALVLRLLEKDPAKRPASASEVREQLERLRDAVPEAAPRRARSRPMTPAVTLPGVSEQALAPVDEALPPPPAPPRMPWVAIGVALVVLILGAVVFALWGPRAEVPPPPPPVVEAPPRVEPPKPVVEAPVVEAPPVEPPKPGVRSKHTAAQVKKRWRQLLGRVKTLPRDARRPALVELEAARDCQRAPDACWQELSELEAKLFQ